MSWYFQLRTSTLKECCVSAKVKDVLNMFLRVGQVACDLFPRRGGSPFKDETTTGPASATRERGHLPTAAKLLSLLTRRRWRTEQTFSGFRSPSSHSSHPGKSNAEQRGQRWADSLKIRIVKYLLYSFYHVHHFYDSHEGINSVSL